MDNLPMVNASKKRLLGVSVFALVIGGYLTSAINYTVPRIFATAQNISTEAATEKVSHLTYLSLFTFIVSALLAAYIGGILAKKKGWLVGLIANSIYIILFGFLFVVTLISGSDTSIGGISAQLYIFLALILLVLSSIFGGIWGQKSYDEDYDLDKDKTTVTIFGIRWGNYFWILPLIIYPFLSSLIYIVYAAVVAYLADFYFAIHPTLWLNIAWWLYFAIVPIIVLVAVNVFTHGLTRFFSVMQYGQNQHKGLQKFWRAIFYGIGAPMLSWGLAAMATAISHNMPKPVNGDWKIGLVLIMIFPAIALFVGLISWIGGRVRKNKTATVVQKPHAEIAPITHAKQEGHPKTKALAKVLHFEDDTFLTGMYKIKFPMKGFDYVAYDSPGEDPVKIVLAEKPDLIIMDIIMPKMDGYAATKLLKADSRTTKIPILGLCNLGQKENIQTALDLGMTDYLVSAAHMPDDVVKRVKNILSISE